jgi:hypothetical protein
MVSVTVSNPKMAKEAAIEVDNKGIGIEDGASLKTNRIYRTI